LGAEPAAHRFKLANEPRNSPLPSFSHPPVCGWLWIWVFWTASLGVMKFRSLLLAVEAFALGAPISAAALYGLPVLLSFGIAFGVSKPLSLLAGLAALAGSVWALLEYWRLAAMTVLRHQYSFGARYWLACAGAATGALSFFGSMPVYALAWLVAPPLVGAVHFSFLQALSRRRQRAQVSAS